MRSSKQEFLEKGWVSAGSMGEEFEILVKEDEHGSILYRTLFDGFSTGQYPESINKDIIKILHSFIF